MRANTIVVPQSSLVLLRFRRKVVDERIGIHGPESLTKEILVLVRQIDLLDLLLHVRLELILLLLGILGAKVLRVTSQIVHGHIVVRIDAVVRMDLPVDDGLPIVLFANDTVDPR